MHPRSIPSCARARRRRSPSVTLAALAACGGEAGAAAPTAGTQYVDANHYSAAAGASLSDAQREHRRHAPVADAGRHPDRLHRHRGPPDRARFEPGRRGVDLLRRLHGRRRRGATRPVTFFFNGGPGSASVWLHLGSFAPRRLVTGVPATTQAVPFPYVDNADSLIDTSDLVFVDAVGTGLSEAIAPHTNQTYWGVDADAARAARLRPALAHGQRPHGVAAVPLRRVVRHHARAGAHAPARDGGPARQRRRGAVVHPRLQQQLLGACRARPRSAARGFLPSYAATGELLPPGDGRDERPGRRHRHRAHLRRQRPTRRRPRLAGDNTLPPPSHIAALVAFTGLPTGDLGPAVRHGLRHLPPPPDRQHRAGRVRRPHVGDRWARRWPRTTSRRTPSSSRASRPRSGRCCPTTWASRTRPPT